MRLFVALAPGRDVKESLARYLRDLEPELGLKKVRLTRTENFHLTLSFLGETEVGRLTLLKSLLAESAAEAHGFVLETARPDCFASTVYLGFQKSTGLAGLVEILRENLVRGGFSRPEPFFRAHLTLARVSAKTKILPSQAGRIKSLPGPGLVFPAEEFHLFQSRLGPDGPRYEVLDTFALGAPESEGTGVPSS